MIRTAPTPSDDDASSCEIVQLFAVLEVDDDPLTIPPVPPALPTPEPLRVRGGGG